MSNGPPGMIITAQDIAIFYNAAMDSVTLINEIVAGSHDHHMNPSMKSQTLKRNADHLDIVVSKDWWTTENLQPFHDAIAAARAAQ